MESSDGTITKYYNRYSDISDDRDAQDDYIQAYQKKIQTQYEIEDQDWHTNI
jgi:hypothetical protein